MEDMGKLIRTLYGNKSKEVLEQIKTIIEDTPKVKIETPNPAWYKNILLYIAYSDIVEKKGHSFFVGLQDHLDHIHKLGCNTLHILPFLESPMRDAGFDVSDFYKIRKDCGTFDQLMAIKKKADKLGIRIFMDLVFNHVSDQHEWFKKAENGDEKYREYFIYTKKKPHFIKKYHKDSAVWAEYRENKKIIKVNVAFPEYTGEIPHWRQGKDGYWYYHTYYPHQLDINWLNPDVFIECIKIMTFWAKHGFNFRLDAIPFIGKGPYKQEKDTDKTYQIAAAINCIAKIINPECTFIAETYEKLDTIIGYFGNANNRQIELAYNFHLCTYLWISILKKNSHFIWHQLKEMDTIPKHAEWLNFLRNHDELSLAYLPDKLSKEISKDLLKNGKGFREGYGVSGRTFSFLNSNTRRFIMSYFLLASIPGSISIPYGDEIGMKNISENKLTEDQKKDTRNINRGKLTQRLLRSQKAHKIYTAIQGVFEGSKLLIDYLNVWPKPYKPIQNRDVFAGSYRVGSSELITIVNLSSKRKKWKLDLQNFKEISHINAAKVTSNNVTLGGYGGVWLQK